VDHAARVQLGQLRQRDVEGCADHFPGLLAFADDHVGFMRRPLGGNQPDWPSPVVPDVEVVARARDRAHGRRDAYVETEVTGAVQHHLF
jgi:hypothetical protein